jgi:hypothetical protein
MIWTNTHSLGCRSFLDIGVMWFWKRGELALFLRKPHGYAHMNSSPYVPAFKWRQDIFKLGLIVLVGFAIRSLCALYLTGAVGSEGAEYARLAENLRNGRGYVGIDFPGAELNFSPLFPLLISLASIITGDYLWAGRLVSVILGTLLALPIYGISSRLFNRRAAIVAALLVALHPLLIDLSTAVLAECPYFTLLLSGIYAVLVALESPRIYKWCVAGGFFGLAYLVRPEAYMVLFVSLVFAGFATTGPVELRVKRIAAAGLVFFAIASPFIVYLYRETGTLRLEGKTALFLAEAKHELAGESRLVGGYGIDSNLKGTGTSMTSNAQIIRTTHLSSWEMFRFVRRALYQNTPFLFQELSSRWLGAPFLSTLAFLGMICQPWRRPVLPARLFFLVVSLCPILAPLVLLHGALASRFYFILVPFIIVWASNGFLAVAQWVKITLAPLTPGWRSSSLCGAVVSGLILLVMVTYSINGVRWLDEFHENSTDSRDTVALGSWIRAQQPGPIRIIDISPPLAFHAGAEYVHFPYSSGDMALRFLDASKVDFIVLRQGQSFSDYYQQWVSSGIPDARAELIYKGRLIYMPAAGDPGTVLVYRWHRSSEFNAAELVRH